MKLTKKQRAEVAELLRWKFGPCRCHRGQADACDIEVIDVDIDTVGDLVPIDGEMHRVHWIYNRPRAA